MIDCSACAGLVPLLIDACTTADSTQRTYQASPGLSCRVGVVPGADCGAQVDVAKEELGTHCLRTTVFPAFGLTWWASLPRHGVRLLLLSSSCTARRQLQFNIETYRAPGTQRVERVLQAYLQLTTFPIPVPSLLISYKMKFAPDDKGRPV